MPTILLSTLGATPDIIEETIGIFNYDENLDFYRGNAYVENLRRELEKVDEVWLVATDQQHKDLPNDKIILSVRESYDYICQNCTKYGAAIRIFVLDGVPDITNEYDAMTFHDLLLRVVAFAKQEKRDGKLYLSLACGRKTMSTDMQDAAYLFGCDNLLHVLGDRMEDATPMLMGGLAPNEAVKPQTAAFEGAAFLRCSPSIDYLSEIERQKRQSQHFFTTYYLNEQETRANFHVLYTLPPSKIEQLKTEKLGVDFHKQDVELEWLRKLPKSDLHCHLGGALTPADIVKVSDLPQKKREEFCFGTPDYKIYLNGDMQANFQVFLQAGWKKSIREISDDLGVPRFAVSLPLLQQFDGREEELRRFWYGEYCDEAKFCGVGINRYEQLGDLQGSNLLDYPYGLDRALEMLLTRCCLENVKYLEIRCSPFNYLNADSTVDDVVARICRALDKVQSEIETSLILIISRHRNDVSGQYVELMRRLRDDELFHRFFRGFDLAGNESIRQPEELRNSFLDIMKECYNITIHAGETESVENIWQAVYHLNAERIGHGLHLLENKELLTKFLERGIAVEMCPSSNFQIVGFRDNYLTKETSHLSEYPIKAYLDKELKVSVNTDDPGISMTDMTHELHKAARMTSGGLSKWDILQLVCNGFRSAFYPYDRKKQLIRKVEKELGNLIQKGEL